MTESADDYMARQRAYWAAHAATPLPAIVEEALRRTAGGETLLSATAWVWNAADTDARLVVDDWMQATKCSLLGVQGRERRFRLLVDSEHETRLNEAQEARLSGRAP
jgi:hypothetical protein